jgi:hypothetical protein
MPVCLPALLVVLAAAAGCVGTATSAGGGCPGSGLVTAQFAQTSATQNCFLSGGGGQSGTLQDTGNPTDSPQWLSIALQFGSNDLLTGTLCSYQSGATFPLTTGCIGISAKWTTSVAADAQGTVQWTAYAGQPNVAVEMEPLAPQPTGSLTLEQWPDAAGGPISVTFSSDATLTSLDTGQQPSILVPIAGTATGAS